MSDHTQTALPGARHPELAGRVAVVTGAAKGIGRGIAERLTAESMRVVLADLDAGALDATTAMLQGRGATVLAVAADLSRDEGVDHLFRMVDERFGTVDLLVNNAADLQRRSVLDEHRALLDLQMATNVAGPYLCSQQAAATMEPIGRGVIVNLSSVGGLQAHHRGVPYDVTKGAIDAMTRAMAVDLGPYGIRVNAVAPGVTTTEQAAEPETEHTTKQRDDRDRGELAARIPLRRLGTVHDMAAVVAFLASDDASYITGQVLYVDGGITGQLSPPGPHAF